MCYNWGKEGETMKKIIALGVELDDDVRDKVKQAGGEVVFRDSPTSVDDFLVKVKGADAIYSNGNFLLESLPRLENVFITYPYIELGEFNSAELEKRGVCVANARGGNKNSIVEWVSFMTIALFRDLMNRVRVAKSITIGPTKSLEGKKALIVGHGDIGTEIGQRLSEFGMEVDYFNRGDNLSRKSKNSDLVVNALNVNTSSRNLLDEKFFASLKKSAYFVSFARRYTYDLEGLIAAINAGILAGAAIDCDPEKPGDVENDFYKTALACEKILVTPHTAAFATDTASKRGHEIAVDNIISFLNGKPKNIVQKR
jgi:D-3-phosphoglycerate dehydrogenase